MRLLLALCVGVCASCGPAPAVGVCNDDDDCDDGAVCLEGACAVVDVVGEGEGEGEGDVVGEGEGDVVGEGEGDVVGEGEGEGDVGEGEGEGDVGDGEGEGEGEGDVIGGPCDGVREALDVDVAGPESVEAGVPFDVFSAVRGGVAPITLRRSGDDVLVGDGELVALYGGFVHDGVVVEVEASDACGEVVVAALPIAVTPPSDCSVLENGAPGVHPTGTYTLRRDGFDVDVFCLFRDADPFLDGYGLAFVVSNADNALTFDSPFWSNDLLFGPPPSASSTLSGKYAAAILAGSDLAVGFLDGVGARWAHTVSDGGLEGRPVDVLSTAGAIDNSIGRAAWRTLLPSFPTDCGTFQNTFNASTGVRFGASCDANPFGAGTRPASVTGAPLALIASRRPDFRAFPVARDCLEHRQRGRSVTGRYLADFGTGVAVEVHCDMDLDGGGWTLIARSDTESPDAPFGWGLVGGAINNFGSAYSLGAQPTFRSLLIADRGTGVTPEDAAYVFDVNSQPFFNNGQANVTAQRTLLGGCDLSFNGVTREQEGFPIDVPLSNVPVGLERGALHLPGCVGDGDQGLLYAR